MAENGKVIVTGCLGKRADVIRQAHPGVLSISGPQDYASVMDAVHAALPPTHDPFISLVPPQGWRLRVTNRLGHFSMLFCPRTAKIVMEELNGIVRQGEEKAS